MGFRNIPFEQSRKILQGDNPVRFNSAAWVEVERVVDRCRAWKQRPRIEITGRSRSTAHFAQYRTKASHLDYSRSATFG
jgi:hypothetical protein